MSERVPVKCPECSGKTVPHCEKVRCLWWKCSECDLYGDTHGRSARVPK